MCKVRCPLPTFPVRNSTQNKFLLHYCPKALLNEVLNKDYSYRIFDMMRLCSSQPSSLDQVFTIPEFLREFLLWVMMRHILRRRKFETVVQFLNFLGLKDKRTSIITFFNETVCSKNKIKNRQIYGK